MFVIECQNHLHLKMSMTDYEVCGKAGKFWICIPEAWLAWITNEIVIAGLLIISSFDANTQMWSKGAASGLFLGLFISFICKKPNPKCCQ